MNIPEVDVRVTCGPDALRMDWVTGKPGHRKRKAVSIVFTLEKGRGIRVTIKKGRRQRFVCDRLITCYADWMDASMHELIGAGIEVSLWCHHNPGVQVDIPGVLNEMVYHETLFWELREWMFCLDCVGVRWQRV